MAKYKISGIWKENGIITHYAIHIITATGVTRSKKIAKAAAVQLLLVPGNEAVTWLWDYKSGYWKDGERVDVIERSFLRSRPDGTVRDNLGHLINYEWI